MRFADVYEGWQVGRLSQEEAAEVLGVSERTFRRFSRRFEEDGPPGLLDRRLGQVSARLAPVDEIVALSSLYRGRYADWTVKHFFDFYQAEHRGTRSYTWVKKSLQAQGVVVRAKRRGAHRRKRERRPLPGMMLHQDGSRHPWLAGGAMQSDYHHGRCHQRDLFSLSRRRRRHDEQLAGGAGGH